MDIRPIKPRLSIVCDCCGETATRKGGEFPHYLCEDHAGLPGDAVVRLMWARYRPEGDVR